ncbi:MAG: PACE efflux transporter [Bermanella sp.]
MSTIERLFQSVLFEILALAILTLLAILVTGGEATTMTGLAIALALIAMGWNYIFNLIFDKKYGHDRLGRTFKMRIAHGICFELGMLIVSLPVIMWALNLGVWAALVLDIGVVVFFLVYAIAFNWAYDVIRDRLVTSNVNQIEIT